MAVGLLLGLRDRLERSRVDDHDLRDVRLDDPSDRQRVPGRLQRDPVTRVKLHGELAQLLGSRRDLRCTARDTLLPDTDLAEVAVHVQADTASLHGCLLSLAFDGVSRRRRAHDTDGFVLKAHPGKS